MTLKQIEEAFENMLKDPKILEIRRTKEGWMFHYSDSLGTDWYKAKNFEDLRELIKHLTA